MAWIMSDDNKAGGLDKTVTPELALTNSSTYDDSSSRATVLLDEISGNGYARASLTVQSNAIDADDFGKITYQTVTFTASGGPIVFDRFVLLADARWVAYDPDFAATIADGESLTFSLVWGIGQQGVILRGLDGIDAFTMTTASFTQPAVGGTVTVSVDEGRWAVLGSTVFFSDGVNEGYYEVTVTGTTSLQLQNLGLSGSAPPTTIMGSAGSLAPSGLQGATVTGAITKLNWNILTTTPPASGEVRADNGTPASITELYVSETSRDGQDLTGFYDFISDGSYLQVVDENDATNYINVTLDGQTLQSGYREWAVTYDSNGGTIADTTEVSILVSPSGGMAGPQGGGYSWFQTLDNNAVVDPAAGEIHLDNTVTESVTSIEISEDAFWRSTDASPDWDISETLDLIPETSILRVEGLTSDAIATYQISSATLNQVSGVDASIFRIYAVNFLDASAIGTAIDQFTDGEKVTVTVLPAPLLPEGTDIVATGTYTPLRHEYLRVDASSGNIIVTIGQVTENWQITFSRIDTSGNTVTIQRSSATTIVNATSQNLPVGSVINLRYNSTTDNWELWA